MSPKCVYGEHEVHQYGRCSSAPEDGMMCEPEPSTKLTPEDFASLLEREPLPPTKGMTEREYCIHELDEYGYPNAARLLREGPDSIDEKIKPTKTALASAQERIKSLEGVLVAIRAGITAIKNYGPGEFDDCRRRRNAALDRVLDLIAETLDPCKPWCVLAEEGRKHEGACISDEGVDRDE